MNALILVVALFAVLSAAPAPAAEVAALRAQIEATFFVPQPLPALAASTHRTFAPAPGVRVEAVTYSTQLGARVPALLYLPDPLPAGGKIPAFVVVNGHGGDKYAWYAYYTGVVFAQGGMAVLTYDQAGEGERSSTRRSGTRDHDKLKGDAMLARRLAGLMITDVRQAVSYLAARPEVDPARIGAGGYSLGSFVLALAGAVEPRLRACVLVGGGNLDGPDGYWDHSKPMCQGLPYRSLDFLGDRPAVLYALHAARGPLLFSNGRADTVVHMDETQDAFFDDLRARVMAVRGTSEGVFEYQFSPTTSHRPYWLTLPVVRWLERQLDFPRWDDSALARLPVTPIAEWAQRTGMPMDKLYATEEREGGTRAIGAGVPGIAREELSVFTAAEWEVRRRELSFDAWAERARAAGAR
ncbi:MAG: acetylxylan esterase [Verrucomicrobiota bacterium]